MIWPSYLDDAGIMAKSQEKGGQTLAEHTWEVLARLADQRRLHAHMPPEIWNWLFWGGLLHDFGKAADGFQQMLAGNRDHPWVEGRQRHEILSLGFVDWLLPKTHPDRPWVLAAVAFHHKDMGRIEFKYGGSRPSKETLVDQKDGIKFLAQQIDDKVRELLWHWVVDCAESWAAELNLPIQHQALMNKPDAMQMNLAKSIFQALRDINRWYEALDELNRHRAMLCRGLIVASDHAASAGEGAFESLLLNDEIVQRPFMVNGFAPRPHQRESGELKGWSAILVAPTGSGKTEAALLWAAEQHRQRPASRLFYTLPYQASMNAMAERLAKRFYDVPFSSDDNKSVTIQHSRAVLQFYRDYMDADSGGNARAAARLARTRLNRTKLNLYPVKVFSPYQMLKVPYALRGYEPLLAEYTDALFIFDEIHAYDPNRLALIITLIEWLRTFFNARFFVMTATLPSPVRDAIMQALFDGDVSSQVIRAHPDTFADARRHTVVKRDGDLLACTDEITEHYHKGESILVCCNTVARAQSVYDMLKDNVPDSDIRMLHGRFAGRDRSAREKWLLERVGTNVDSADRQPTVFVATQVVEVSLDVDFDVLFTDPAPLEALLQRFGRVNRGRGEKPPLCEVHVFSEPSCEDDSKPYDYRYVQRALEILENGPVDEAIVDDLLAQVYTGELLEEWQEAYKKSVMSFRAVTLDVIRPFESSGKDIQEKFYELFDGRQILPAYYADSYDTALEQGGYLAASEYLVNVSEGQYWACGPLPYDDYVHCTKVPYTPELGLDLQKGTGQQDDDV